MATTPNGLPYPVGTDKVVDGDDAIKALALKLDPRAAPVLVGAVDTFPLSTTEASVAALALTPGTWDITATCYLDWSTTTPPRFTVRLQAPGWVLVDEGVVFLNTIVGSASVALSKPGLVVATAGNVTLAAYMITGGGAGNAILKQIKLRGARSA